MKSCLAVGCMFGVVCFVGLFALGVAATSLAPTNRKPFAEAAPTKPTKQKKVGYVIYKSKSFLGTQMFLASKGWTADIAKALIFDSQGADGCIEKLQELAANTGGDPDEFHQMQVEVK